jgi:hypothetical protein
MPFVRNSERHRLSQFRSRPADVEAWGAGRIELRDDLRLDRRDCGFTWPPRSARCSLSSRWALATWVMRLVGFAQYARSY